MKLITKASRIFLVTCSVALFIGTFLGIVTFKRLMSHEATEHLLNQRGKVENYILQNNQLPKNQFTLSDSLWFRAENAPARYELKDTLLYNQLEGEPLMYRQISFGVKVSGSGHTAFILHPMYETEDLTEAIIFTLFGIVLLILSALFTTNYLISKRLWQPFYKTLENLSGFRIAQQYPLVFEPTKISEFNQLQDHLSDLTNKVRGDYQSLKSFTENASHELQTPLSVIGSNLEMLIQDDNLTAGQLQRISTLIDELGKVSKLNQTLLLLTKIENRQFGSVKLLNVSEIVQQKLSLLENWVSHKNIALQTKIQDKVFVEINPYLLDVLLNNIMSNAIRHNEPNGNINLKLSSGTLVVSNTGDPLLKSPEELFGRFQKDKSVAGSIGLGLSIIKQICETYGFDVTYECGSGLHTISVSFDVT